MLCLALLLVAGATPASRAGADSPVPASMWTRYAQVAVQSSPAGPLLSQLDTDQEVRVTGATTVAGARWLRVQLWGALSGWVRADLLAPVPVPNTPPGGVPVAPRPVGPHAPMALHARAVAAGPAGLRELPDSGARLLRRAPSGATLRVVAWATDGLGLAWYQIGGPGGGWVSADEVNLRRGAPTADLAAVAGLGMWCTPPVLAVAPPRSLVAAARANHITHLYVEVAHSYSGFTGAASLAALLPVAHAAHIAVIAWVYPFLNDVPLDVALAVRVARYVAPSGDRPDGLMADVEQNMQEPYVRAYGQVVRALLGPRVLMGIATYPPQSYWGMRYPFRTVARSWDVIVPMDYWHLRPRPYSAQEAARYVTASIAGIRQAVGAATVPIEVLGQMFDVYQDGRNSPSAAEIEGAMHAAIAGHAAGISFFEWNHATPGEWDALRAWPAHAPGRNASGIQSSSSVRREIGQAQAQPRCIAHRGAC
jgi:hypothetical protein